jgi:hypothetical protein
MRTILSVLLLVSIYLIVAMLPAVAIMCSNYFMDPSAPWVNVAVAWLSDSGIPYASIVLVVGYVGIVFYPSIKFALRVCDPLFPLSEGYE